MNHTRYITALCAAVLPFALVLVANGCGNKEEETPPPVPSAAPAPTPAPTPTPLVVEEDAGSDASDAGEDADAGKKVVGTGDSTGIRACCAALRQNANSAPLDQKGSYLAAAGMCDGLVNSPEGRQALTAVRNMLKGAGAPAACK
ncbi:acyltransferase [Polyangium sp. 6x1]|uniref:acyltransferase n=1 Tax=Polyangium sp. 6x1 TaxID=3042689 RepID=UPI002482D5A3|nr:acyltransferase [Polyangium sp. 6x1]MDI1451096.1 acyltransferase [Polyangium sp. 6x1]